MCFDELLLTVLHLGHLLLGELLCQCHHVCWGQLVNLLKPLGVPGRQHCSSSNNGANWPFSIKWAAKLQKASTQLLLAQASGCHICSRPETQHVYT